MSKESAEWLNTNVLVGFTEKRKNQSISWLNEDGTAWHNDEELRASLGVENNHYEGAIPVEDVLRRLFSWHAVKLQTQYTDPNGVLHTSKTRQIIAADDTWEDLGAFKNGYEPHQFDEWLVEGPANLINHGSGLGISSAALLKNRGVAFVQIELPETVQTPEGFAFSPYLGAATSFDGSLATTYKTGATVWCCDNSFGAGLSEAGSIFKVKHTRNSGLQIANARAALGIIEQVAESFTEEIARLASIDVTLAEWGLLLDELVPVAEEDGRSRTIAENKRDVLEGLYKSDSRVSPWAGTALGVVQAFNTYGQHFQTVRNASRGERNLTDIVFGRIEDSDENTLKAISNVRAKRVLVHA